jgi:hypothetical protein
MGRGSMKGQPLSTRAIAAALGLEEHVRRLQVAVDDARAGVQEVQPVAELAAERLPPGPVQGLEPAVELPVCERA